MIFVDFLRKTFILWGGDTV